MQAFTIVHHNGWDYWLDKHGIVSKKSSSGNFWEKCLGDLPAEVKRKLGIDKFVNYVAASCVLETRWSDSLNTLPATIIVPSKTD